MAGQVKVVYLLGAARSGTSLLTSLLGELEGVFAAAEMRLLWKGFDTRLCGCGASVGACPIWTGAVEAAREASGLDDPGQFRALQAATTRVRHLPTRLKRGAHGRAATYLRAMESMYVSLSEASGAGVMVDSSKSPSEAVLLRSSHRAVTYLVHVVRDPRAVAYSWERAGRRESQNTKSSLESATDWVVSNLAAEMVGRRYPADRRLRVRYEDYVTDPAAALTKVARLVGIDPGAMDFLRGPRPRASRHMVGGNALRFDDQVITLNPDTEWLENLRPFRSALTIAATLPLMVRYGYSIRPSSRSPDDFAAPNNRLEDAP